RFPGKPVVGKPADKPAVEVAQVEVEWHGTWYPAKILEQKDGKFYIKYDGWGDEWNEWVGKERIRLPAKGAVIAPDGKVEVFWSTTWFPAKILMEKDGKYLIKYDGYGDEWNEWVGKDRIRVPAKVGVVPAEGKVEVEWAGTWYPAKILEKKDGKFY